MRTLVALVALGSGLAACGETCETYLVPREYGEARAVVARGGRTAMVWLHHDADGASGRVATREANGDVRAAVEMADTGRGAAGTTSSLWIGYDNAVWLEYGDAARSLLAFPDATYPDVVFDGTNYHYFVVYGGALHHRTISETGVYGPDVTLATDLPEGDRINVLAATDGRGGAFVTAGDDLLTAGTGYLVDLGTEAARRVWTSSEISSLYAVVWGAGAYRIAFDGPDGDVLLSVQPDGTMTEQPSEHGVLVLQSDGENVVGIKDARLVVWNPTTGAWDPTPLTDLDYRYTVSGGTVLRFELAHPTSPDEPGGLSAAAYRFSGEPVWTTALEASADLDREESCPGDFD